MSSTKPPSENENIDPVDITIGKNIQFRRKLLGITQKSLAQKTGISFQQIQKYEAGKNKLSASRLYHMSKILQTPLGDFFKDDIIKPGLSDQGQENFSSDSLLDTDETATLLRFYYEIEDKKKRKTALDMMKALQS